MKAYQDRVDEWMFQCFPWEIIENRTERNLRFAEEALELVQSLQMTKEQAQAILNYVYDREAGDPAQEVGGVMVTLAALCNANDLDMTECGELELTRVSDEKVIAKIKSKHQAKPLLVRTS